MTFFFPTSLKKKIQCNVALLSLLFFVEMNKAFSTVAIAHNYTAFNSSVLAHIKVQKRLWKKKMFCGSLGRVSSFLQKIVQGSSVKLPYLELSLLLLHKV